MRAAREARGAIEWHRGGARLEPRADAHDAAEHRGAGISALPSRATTVATVGKTQVGSFLSVLLSYLGLGFAWDLS